MEVKRRELLKAGVVTLAAASMGVIATGVTGKRNVAEAADAPDYKIYALKYAGPFTSAVAMVFFNKEWDKTISRPLQFSVLRVILRQLTGLSG